MAQAHGTSAQRDAIIVAGDYHSQITASPSAPISTLHQLPPVPPAFTGRKKDLDALERILTCDHAIGASISAGLQGMGGIGKTALAIVLAHRLKSRYPAAQLFINLRGADPDRRPPLTPEQVMQAVIQAFHPEARLPEALDELAAIYHSSLAQAGPVLLLLDNATNDAQVTPLIPPGNCLLLVTSRARLNVDGVVSRDLDCLPPEDAHALLLKIAPRLAGKEAEAAGLCGHLPLALQVFGKTVLRMHLHRIEDLLARLRNREGILAPVDAAMELSWELLPDELRNRWVLLSLFSASFNLSAAAAVWELEDDPALDAMQTLVNASLVEWNEAETRFRLHDLVRAFCEGRLPEAERDAARMRHAGHYRDIGGRADDLFLSGGDGMVRGLEIFDRERSHIDAAFDWLHRRADEDSGRLLASLVDAVVYVGSLRFHPRERIHWLTAQREATCRIGDRSGEGNALGNLGLAYAALGDSRKAIDFYEQALVISREMGDCRGEGSDLGNLGLAYANLGDSRKAIGFYEQALVISREIGDRRTEGSSLGNLGNAHANLGDPRKAIDFHERRLVIAREIGDRRGEGNALGNLGNAYANLGDPRKAIDFYEQQFAITREIGDRRGEGSSLGSLGSAYANLGDPRKAIDFHEQRLVIAREIGDRRGEGNAFGNLGNAYANLGDPGKAIDFYEQALIISREIGDRRGEGSDLGNLGNAYAALGDPGKAINFYEQALIISREIGNRRSEASALWNSADEYARQGNLPEAISRAEAALPIYEAMESPHVEKVRNALLRWRGETDA